MEQRETTARQAAAERVQRPQAKTTERREAVLKAAMNVFGARGYNKGALVEVAEQAGHDPRRRAAPLRQQGRPARRDAEVPRRRRGRRRARPRPDRGPCIPAAPRRHRGGEHAPRAGWCRRTRCSPGNPSPRGTPRTTTSRGASTCSAQDRRGARRGRRATPTSRSCADAASALIADHGRAAGAVAARARGVDMPRILAHRSWTSSSSGCGQRLTRDEVGCGGPVALRRAASASHRCGAFTGMSSTSPSAITSTMPRMPKYGAPPIVTNSAKPVGARKLTARPVVA